MEQEQKKSSDKLAMWQERLSQSDAYWETERGKMDRREKLYNGSRDLEPLTSNDKKNGQNRTTTHRRNIIFENIESQISTQIPSPKVTARRKKDEPLAALIEHYLRNELDRQPFEEMNDMAERTVPIQGGVGYLVEWDNSKRTHTTIGEADVSVIHPKQFAPQPGVYTGIEDMDWFIVKVPTTKEVVRRRYGKSIYDESESEPDVRSTENQSNNEDAVTLYVGYERSDTGINKYCWVNDVELEDLEDYQARRQPVCRQCGRVKPLPGQIIYNNVQTTDDGMGMSPEGAEEDAAARVLAQILAGKAMAPEEEQDTEFLSGVETEAKEEEYKGGACPWCGCEDFDEMPQQYEEILLPMQTANGVEIPGPTLGFNAETGMPEMQAVKIPYYKPDMYPIILQRSVSTYGQLLGTSDVDMIEDQQNTVNRMEMKIIDRLIKAGTRITLPDRPELRNDSEDGERWFVGNAAEKAMIGVYQFSGNLQYEMEFQRQVYEEARQILGITESWQGRKDPTATSGVARQYATAQTAGRLESKRMMKNAAYAKLFEMMFKFALAYGDEPRPISYKDFNGDTQYEEFNRYDFLEMDRDGQWYWNDQFLFSCDTSASLAGNREAMWQETRLNLQTGAFGNPAETSTLLLFWAKMEELHYPGASGTKKHLEERLQMEQQAAQMQNMQAAQMQGIQMAGPDMAQAQGYAPEEMALAATNG